jgi:hypothetical protein
MLEGQNMRIYSVYGLVDPVSHLVRYVGKTTNRVEQRYKQHCSGKDVSTGDWVRSLMEPPVLVILETGEERVLVFQTSRSGAVWASAAAETKWIKRHRRTIINTRFRDNCPREWDRLTNPEGRV